MAGTPGPRCLPTSTASHRAPSAFRRTATPHRTEPLTVNLMALPSRLIRICEFLLVRQQHRRHAECHRDGEAQTFALRAQSEHAGQVSQQPAQVEAGRGERGTAGFDLGHPPGCRRSASSRCSPLSGYGAQVLPLVCGEGRSLSRICENPRNRRHGRLRISCDMLARNTLLAWLGRRMSSTSARSRDTSRKILTMPWNSPLPSNRGQSSVDGDLLSVR